MITSFKRTKRVLRLKPDNLRLDSTDAEFVDIVYIDVGGFGIISTLGYVDFFVNGGGPIQPACVNQPLLTNRKKLHTYIYLRFRRLPAVLRRYYIGIPYTLLNLYTFIINK